MSAQYTLTLHYFGGKRVELGSGFNLAQVGATNKVIQQKLEEYAVLVKIIKQRVANLFGLLQTGELTVAYFGIEVERLVEKDKENRPNYSGYDLIGFEKLGYEMVMDPKILESFFGTCNLQKGEKLVLPIKAFWIIIHTTCLDRSSMDEIVLILKPYFSFEQEGDSFIFQKLG